jgi:hypothetical protein
MVHHSGERCDIDSTILGSDAIRDVCAISLLIHNVQRTNLLRLVVLVPSVNDITNIDIRIMRDNIRIIQIQSLFLVLNNI